MKQITIPFNEWSLERLADERKSATTRTKRYGYAGDTFKVEMPDGTVREYVLTKVKRCTLVTVARYHWRVEGCESQEEFWKIWKWIHPRKPIFHDQMVYFHKFKEVKVNVDQEHVASQARIMTAIVASKKAKKGVQ